MAALAPYDLHRLRGRTAWLMALLLWVCDISCALRAQAVGSTPPAVDPALPVLHTMRQLWDMPTDQKEKPHKVCIDLHATYYDPQWKLLWALSEETPVFVPLGTAVPEIRTGDVIRAEGVTRPVEAFALSNFAISVIERDRALPALVVPSFADSYQLNTQFLRIEALVEAQFETDQTHLELHMIVDGRRLRGRMLVPADAPIPILAGQVITVEGVFAPDANPNPDFFAQFWIGRPSHVRNSTPLSEHPDFSLPQTMISQISKTSADEIVRLAGRVVHFAPNAFLTLEDPTGRINVSTAQTLGIDHGAEVEVCGVPTLGRDGWHIERALVRASPENAAPTAQRVSMSPEDLPLLDSLQAYWGVESSRKDMLHRFSFVLHVSYFDADWGLLWFQNGNDFSFINADRKDVLLHTGQVVRIEGLTRPSDPIVLSAASTITSIYDYDAIEPIDLDGKLDQAASYNARTVRLTGLVERQQEVDPTHAMLIMVVDGHRVEARSRLANSDVLLELAGHIISVEGVLVPRGTASDLLTADLWIGRMGSIRPLARLEDDPQFNIEATPIDALQDAPTDQLTRIVGVLHALEREKGLVVRDATGQVHIATSQYTGIKAGEVVEVRGYPRKSGSDWTLVRPVARTARADSVPSASGPTPAVLYRMADQVMSLPPEVAQAANATKLRGTVVWSSPQHASIFIRDASGGIEVRRPDTAAPPPVPGTAVVVSGVTALGSFAPRVDAHQIEGLGSETIPNARLVTLEQAMTGIEEAQRIALRGYVRSVNRDEAWTTLELFATGGDFAAKVPADPDLERMQGALVEVVGTCSAISNERRQLTGIQLWLNASTDIKELQSAPKEAFEGELRQIGTLRQFGGRHAFGSRIRVQGTLLLQIPGRYVIVNDGSGGLVAYTRDSAVLQPGDAVEVAGLPGFDGPRTVMREASIRPTGSHEEVSPDLLNPNGLLNELHDARLARVDATLLDVVHVDRSMRLKMISGGTTFQAILDDEAAAIGAEAPKPGSVLRLTGVYRIGYDEKHRLERFGIQLRSLHDIEVLSVPSWFTASHAKGLAAGLAVIVGLAFAWAYSLRKRVQHQTGQIREQLVKEARLEDRQRKIIEKASDFIFMLDLTGAFTLFNPAGEAITGYNREEVARLTIFDIIIDTDKPSVRAALLNAKPDGAILPVQTQFRRRDGSLVWVEVAARFLSEDTRATGMLCVARDITERKRVEEELKRARDAAEANTKAKSAFLANMSHEIRTPMNGVIGMSNLLLDTSLSHDQRDFALTIRNSAETLLTVLNDILDFSKIEAGKLQFETLDFDLTETVDDTLDLLAARAASKHLELVGLVPASLPQRLRGDPGRLRQVLLNLLGNAIKFTESGQVSLTVSLEHETTDTVVLHFEVEDTGIGIALDQQEGLFVPFSQADVSTTRRYGGTGLGLAICRQIVDQMHGQIGVRSRPGEGSTFWFTIPLQRAATEASEPMAEALRGQRIIAVDDNALSREVIQHYLQPYGVRLALAPNAKEALAMMRAAASEGNAFRVALLDYHMPEIDGLELARAIRADTRLRDTILTLATSVDRRLSASDLKDAGFATSLTKPVRRRELIQALLRAHGYDVTAPNPASAPVAESRFADMPSLRVLVAEDNPVNQRLTRIQLKKLGYEADLACNGNEVLEAFERVAYDVIFMDCQMPELDGYDTARRLSRHARRSEVRIIAMTANAMQGDRDKCIESGMDDYLSKPTRPDDLAAALKRAAEAIARPV